MDAKEAKARLREIYEILEGFDTEIHLIRNNTFGPARGDLICACTDLGNAISDIGFAVINMDDSRVEMSKETDNGISQYLATSNNE